MWSDHTCARADQEMRIAERPWQGSSQMLGCGGWDHKVREGYYICV
jgi:hypothetical protein